MASTSTGGPPPHFHLLGFPVRVGTGFLIFMALLAFLPRPGPDAREFGLWLAGSIAVFTLIHELGHALVARAYGAQAGIALEFMAGYTSFRPTRPIGTTGSIAISVAGPLAHIVAGSAALFALGGNPLDRGSLDTAATTAVWWAGPVIGVINLIPVLPLDGGNVVSTLLEALAPGKGRRWMVYASVAITGAAMASAAVWDRTRDFVVFIGFLLIIQLSSLFAVRNQTARSPFDAAADAAKQGDHAKAAKLLTRGLQRPDPQRKLPTFMASGATVPPELAMTIDQLPRPLPSGNAWNEFVLGSLLVRLDRGREAADYAAARFHEDPSALAASVVARAAASLGDAATAAGWLRAANDHGLDGQQVVRLVYAAPEFAGVRTSDEVQALLRSLAPTPSSAPRRT